MHHRVLVVLDASVSYEDIERELIEVLAPFDENLVMDPYLSISREDLIIRERAKFQNLMETRFVEYMQNQEAFADKYGHFHAGFIGGKLPGLVAGDDDAIWEYVSQEYGSEEIDENGDIISTWNLDGHWDYWVIGGRFNSSVLNADSIGTDTSIIRRGELKSLNDIEGFVGKDGGWIAEHIFIKERSEEKFAFSDEDHEEMREKFSAFVHKELMKVDPQDWLIVVDAHS